MLDRSRPYSQVYGMDGVSWHQDGRNFNFQGQPLDENGQVVKLVEPQEDTGGGIEGLHWKQLQVMMRQYGQEFTSKEAAVQFLKGQGLG